MAKRHEVQILRRAGHSQREIATRLGISERSVRRIEGEEPVRDLDDAAARSETSQPLAGLAVLAAAARGGPRCCGPQSAQYGDPGRLSAQIEVERPPM